VLVNLAEVLNAAKLYGDDAPKPPFYGIYQVQTFIRNNDTIAPLKTDSARWDKLVVSWKGWTNIKMVNDSTRHLAFEPDSTGKKIVMYNYKDTASKYTFNCTYPRKDMLMLTGKWNNDSLKVLLAKQDIKEFLLVNRGFRWINETPLNR